MFKVDYNPDVLSCLANLSSDEVFTPPTLANEILDMLPKELFESKETTFLDPVSKSSVFLREIAKRLIVGLEDEIPDMQTRINHILKNQIFGIAITELTSLLSRRSLYCSKTANGKYSICNEFDTESGNILFDKIQHTWKKGKCEYCGASQGVYDRDEMLETHAYHFIHTENPEEIFNMKFDVIIGNPPYQLSDGGAGASAIPLYHKFVNQAIKLNPSFISMIIPSRWYAGGRGLDSFRNNIQSDKRFKVIVDYPKSRECFPGVDIAGGVCYFLWDSKHHGACNFISRINEKEISSIRELDEFDFIIRDNVGVSIIKKIKEIDSQMLSSKVLKVSPFGLRSYERGAENPFRNCLTLISSGGKGYIKKENVTKNENVIDKYKVCIGYLNPDRAGVNNARDGKINVTTKLRILEKNEVVTETYIIPYYDSDRLKVENCITYLKTKFARFMISLTLSSMHIAQKNFSFVPLQDFDKSWGDDSLYKKYSLNSNQIEHIESSIRAMD